MRVGYFFIQRYAKKNETVNTASENVTSLLITLPAPDDPVNSNKPLYRCTSQYAICVRRLSKFLKFYGSQFQSGDCSLLVLNFWANLSALGFLIKFVLIKKKAWSKHIRSKARLLVNDQWCNNYKR